MLPHTSEFCFGILYYSAGTTSDPRTAADTQRAVVDWPQDEESGMVANAYRPALSRSHMKTCIVYITVSCTLSQCYARTHTHGVSMIFYVYVSFANEHKVDVASNFPMRTHASALKLNHSLCPALSRAVPIYFSLPNFRLGCVSPLFV